MKSAGKTARKKARVLQEATGFGYEACLKIVVGDIRLVPRVVDCDVERGLKQADAHPISLADPKWCSCARCDP